MDSLLDSIAQTQPISLEDLIKEEPLQPLPDSTVKHNSAKLAMLSSDPVNDYQAMLAEASSGVDYTANRIKSDTEKRQSLLVKDGLMSILSDPSVPMSEKESAIRSVNSDWHKEPSAIIANNAFSAPVLNENIEQEQVRLSSAAVFRNTYLARQEQNALGNRRKLEANPGTVVDLIYQILPFSTNVQTTELLTKVAEDTGLKVSKGQSAVLPGEAINAMVEQIRAIPPTERLPILQKIDNIITENHSLIVDGNNSLSAIVQMRAMIAGDYSTFDRVLDDSVTVLDSIGLGSALKSAVKSVTKLFSRTAKDAVSKEILRSVVEAPSPISVIETLAESNPDKAAAVTSLIIKSTDNEIASALAGTSREGAIAHQYLPSASIDGSVTSKIQGVDEKLYTLAKESGGKGFETSEIERAREYAINQFTDVNGISLFDNMLTVSNKDGEQVIKATYGTSKGGFLNAEDALNQTALSLREFGVIESDLTLMKKIDGEYVPITLSESVGKEGDYLVQLNLSRFITPEMTGKLNPFDVKMNWLDRVDTFRSRKAGTLANTVLDHASMLHKNLTGKAVVQTDKATAIDKRFIELLDAFARKFKGLDKKEQSYLYDTINEANAKELNLSVSDLKARGFSDDAVEAYQGWRNYWDNAHWFENQSLVRNLNNQGYQLFDNGLYRLFVKPISKPKTLAGKLSAYDPEIGKTVKISAQELDDLYNSGGNISKLRRPIDFKDGFEEAELVIVKNNSSSYSRALRETDLVLNYRHGYYQTVYDAPKFIVRTVRGANGEKLYEKAVAVAGDSKSAEFSRKRYAQTNGLDNADVRVRDDLKDLKGNEDFNFDLMQASGRTAQKHRGERLGDATYIPNSFDMQYMLNPMEAAVRAARSLSGKIALGDFLSVSKERAMQQYGQYMPEVKGRKMWPSSSKDLVATSSARSSELADARTTVEYLNYLSSGYDNALDDAIKSTLRAVAETAAEYGMTAAEKAAYKASKIGLTDTAKNTVFSAFIALANPVRQWLVQSHSSIRLAAYSPKAFVQSLIDSAIYVKYKIAPDTLLAAPKEHRALVEFVDKSGLMDAVDKHNMVRGAVTDLAMASSPIKRVVGNLVGIPRKIGFDKGEQFNQLMHVLTVRNKFLLEGKDAADPRVADEIHSLSRAISGDMNFAGDMPYNQNIFGLFLQFAQYPHKAFTSMTFNRRIPSNVKMKLALADMALFGIPGGYALEQFIGEDNLPNSSLFKALLHKGWEEYSLNNVLSHIAEKPVNIAFSDSFSPYSVDGYAKFADALLEEGASGLFKLSPIYSLVQKDGKVPEAFKRMVRYLGYADPNATYDKETLFSVAEGFAEISSGWSSGYRAYLALEMGKLKIKGQTVIDNYELTQAIANSLGFRNREEAVAVQLSKDSWDFKKKDKERIREVITSHLNVLTRDQKLSTTDPETVSRMLGFINNSFSNDPSTMKEANDIFLSMVKDKKTAIINEMINAGNLTDFYKEVDALRDAGDLRDEDYDKAIKLLKKMQQDTEAYRKEEK